MSARYIFRQHVTGTKFYCSARSTHSVARGSWYFEIKVVKNESFKKNLLKLGSKYSFSKVVEMPEGAAVRVGWAQKNANLQVNFLLGSYTLFDYSNT